MKTEHLLMNAFRRSVALSRRQKRKLLPQGGEGHVRGMGHVLDSLSPTEGKRQKTLAEELGIRPQSLSEALFALEERGEIVRRTDPADRRVTLVYLTDEGEKKREALAKIRCEHAEAFFGVLTPEEQSQLLSLLEKINAQGETPSNEEKEVCVCRHL